MKRGRSHIGLVKEFASPLLDESCNQGASEAEAQAGEPKNVAYESCRRWSEWAWGRDVVVWTSRSVLMGTRWVEGRVWLILAMYYSSPVADLFSLKRTVTGA